MIATGRTAMFYRSLPSLARAVTRTAPAKNLSVSPMLFTHEPFLGDSKPNPVNIRLFSSTTRGTVSDGKPSPNEIQQKVVGSVTRKLRVLDVNVVKKILEELRSVDVNFDGRLDSDELKQLLRKYSNAFSEQEIVEIGELFYAGKVGGSVSFARFVEAIDQLVESEKFPGKEDDPWEEGTKKQGNPLGVGTDANEYIFVHNHHYSPEDLNIKLTHTQPQGFRDRLALNSVKGVRFVFDQATGWNRGKITGDKILNRAIFLETVAGVPGMVAAIVRHFRSLRTMKRDGGMMQMFLDEANNERMHLLSFVRMKDPGMLFRSAVIGAQVGFGSAFFLSYVISPQFCHRFVGYIEEEACSTYTKIIETIESAPEGSDLAKWRTQLAPKIARSYWKLGESGNVLDMIYAVRADEAEHRDVNHLCSTMEEGMQNPVSNTEEKLNTMLLKYVKDLMDRTPDPPQHKPTHS